MTSIKVGTRTIDSGDLILIAEDPEKHIALYSVRGHLPAGWFLLQTRNSNGEIKFMGLGATRARKIYKELPVKHRDIAGESSVASAGVRWSEKFVIVDIDE